MALRGVVTKSPFSSTDLSGSSLSHLHKLKYHRNKGNGAIFVLSMWFQPLSRLCSLASLLDSAPPQPLPLRLEELLCCGLWATLFCERTEALSTSLAAPHPTSSLSWPHPLSRGCLQQSARFSARDLPKMPSLRKTRRKSASMVLQSVLPPQTLGAPPAVSREPDRGQACAHAMIVCQAYPTLVSCDSLRLKPKTQ